MKLLILSQYFWPENFRINDVAEGLASRGHSVTVYTAMPNYPAGRFFDGYGFLGPFRERYKSAEVRRAPIGPGLRRQAHRVGSARKGGSRRCFLQSGLCGAVRKDLRVPCAGPN